MLLNCGVGEILESPLNCKQIKPVNSKGNQSWIFIGRIDAEAEMSIFWPPSAKTLEKTHWKRLWYWQRLKAGGEGDEIIEWHHWLDGHEFEQALGVGDGHGGLPSCSPWGCKESDMTEQLNWLNWYYGDHMLESVKGELQVSLNCLPSVSPGQVSLSVSVSSFYKQGLWCLPWKSLRNFT